MRQRQEILTQLEESMRDEHCAFVNLSKNYVIFQCAKIIIEILLDIRQLLVKP